MSRITISALLGNLLCYAAGCYLVISGNTDQEVVAGMLTGVVSMLGYAYFGFTACKESA